MYSVDTERHRWDKIFEIKPFQYEILRNSFDNFLISIKNSDRSLQFLEIGKVKKTLDLKYEILNEIPLENSSIETRFEVSDKNP